MRRFRACLTFACFFGLILDPPLIAHADLIGLDYSISESGDSVTIDGESFPVFAIPPGPIEGKYGRLAQFARSLALDGHPDKLVACREIWSYKAYEDSVPIDGAACVLEHDGFKENAILCGSVFELIAISYRGQMVPTRRDIVAFATKACGGYEIRIIHQYDMPEIEYGRDRRGIFQMTAEEAQAQFSKVDTCELGVYLPVGTAHGNVSTGAICRTKRNGEAVRIAVCTDEMVGHYKEREIGDRPMTAEHLAIFTMVYCSAG